MNVGGSHSGTVHATAQCDDNDPVVRRTESCAVRSFGFQTHSSSCALAVYSRPLAMDYVHYVPSALGVTVKLPPALPTVDLKLGPELFHDRTPSVSVMLL